MKRKNVTNRISAIKDAVHEALLEARGDDLSDKSIVEMTAQRISRIVENEENKLVIYRGTRTAASYLRLIRRFLGAMRSGVSRSQFLADALDELGAETGIDRAIFVVEGYKSQEAGDLSEIRISHAVGTNPERLDQLRAGVEKEVESGFLENLLLGRRELDFETSNALADREFGRERYKGEFKTVHGQKNAWFCAQPLAATEKGEPERCLVAIYLVPSELGDAGTPPGAQQEWDILGIIPSIFYLLQYRVRTLRETVAEEQLRMILELAPSAITHELGTGLHLMQLAIGDAAAPLVKLASRLSEDDPDLLEIGGELVRISQLIRTARETTEAFTNLERRNPYSEINLATILDEIETVLHRRLQDARAVMIKDLPQELRLVTDTRYVNHVLMNVIINAVEAIEPEISGSEPDGDIPQYHIAVEARENEKDVEIVIANDGPPIPVQISARIFDKGVTTKPIGVGHGQGLYLCRTIARHLGGEFGFARPPRNLRNAKVSFYLRIPKTAQFESDA